MGWRPATRVQARPPSGAAHSEATGYGRGEPQENWIAFGDDAAVAAGLSGLLQAATGRRLLCGDAIADPLTGLHAALAAWASYRAGGGRLLALALRDVVAHCIGFDLPATTAELRERQAAWTALATRHGVRRPRAPAAESHARPLGA